MIETTVDLIVNKNLTPEQFAQLVDNGLIGENELSFVDDENNPYKGEPGQDGLTTSITMNGETYTVDKNGNIPLGELLKITNNKLVVGNVEIREDGWINSSSPYFGTAGLGYGTFESDGEMVELPCFLLSKDYKAYHLYIQNNRLYLYEGYEAVTYPIATIDDITTAIQSAILDSWEGSY